MTSEHDPYNHLVELIKDRHDHKISDQEAHRLARNLMGYCELAIKVGSRVVNDFVDEKQEHAKLFMRWLYAGVECRNSDNTGYASAHE